MPIADFVQHVGALSKKDSDHRALAAGLSDAAALRAYAAGHGIALSEAEAIAIIDAAHAPDGLRTLSDSDLDGVSGGTGMPEGLSRVLDILQNSISPKNLPTGAPKAP